jgi:hypothetical protein
MSLGNAFKITDDRFSIEKIEAYHLVLEVQHSRLKFYLKENLTNIIIWLEDHYLDTKNSETEFHDKIKNIFAQHEFLKANFWKSITLITDFPCFCEIPETFYDEDLKKQYLIKHFKHLDVEEFMIQTEKIRENIYIFGFPKRLFSIFSEIFNNSEILLKNSAVNNMKRFKENTQLLNKNLLIISDNWLDAIFQSQSTSTIRYLKIALDAKKIEQLLTEIVKDGQIKSIVYGEITPYSAVYKQIKQYLKALEFGYLPKNINLSQYFSEIPEQRYFTLFANN